MKSSMELRRVIFEHRHVRQRVRSTMIVRNLWKTLFMCSVLLVWPIQDLVAKDWSPTDWRAAPTSSSCSAQAEDFFFVAPYSARTDDSEEGGTVEEVAQDGFTTLGLTYQMGDLYETELDKWLTTNLCLIYRLWPTRTVNNPLSPKYHGPVGSLVRAAHKREFICYEAGYPNDDSSPCIDEEIADASDRQVDIWVAQIEQAISDAVTDPVLNKRIVAWYLGPEELRFWEPGEKALLQRIYEIVQQLDPLQRPAWMYNPQHSDIERLVQMGPWMDVLSMGMYPNVSDNVHRRIQVRHALTQLTSASGLLGYTRFGFTKRILPVLEMFEDLNHGYDETDAALVPEFVRHDAYAAFANGADGLLIWSMGYRVGFATYTAYYHAWADLAQEVSTLGLRDVFQHGQVQNAAIATVTNGEATIDFDWAGFHETYPSLSVRDWLFEGKTYVLLVNSSEDEVSFVLDHIPPAVYNELFTDELHDGENGFLELSLPARGVMLLVSQFLRPKGLDDFTAAQNRQAREGD